MPELSRFFGMVIQIYSNDHPPPHFHVRHAGQKAAIEIEFLDIIEGDLSARAFRLIREWAEAHRDELSENWRLAQDEQPTFRIEPLR